MINTDELLKEIDRVWYSIEERPRNYPILDCLNRCTKQITQLQRIVDDTRAEREYVNRQLEMLVKLQTDQAVLKSQMSPLIMAWDTETQQYKLVTEEELRCPERTGY
jgi:hypothetical protein